MLFRKVTLFAVGTLSCFAGLTSVAQGQTQSGFEAPTGIEGRESVRAELYENDRTRESLYGVDLLQQVFEPYFDWKKNLKQDNGLSLGSSYYFMLQEAGDAANGEEDAASAIYRLQGSWAALTLSDGSTGTLNWRVENRSELGSNQSASTLGGQIAGVLNTGFAYSGSFDTDLAIFNWTQGFNENRAGVVAGRLAFDAYLDANAFQTFGRGFINRGFILNPTMATTGTGSLGIVTRGFVSEGVWVGAHLYDANAQSGDFDLDTVGEGEWLKALEIGWAPAQARYRTDKIQLTWWDKDARSLAGIEEGSGWAVSGTKQVSDSTLGFLRFGASDGGAGVAATKSFSVGADKTMRANQNWSLGFAWAELNDATFGDDRDDEMVLETSYKLQLSPNVSMTPDIQYVINPASLPSEDSVVVLSLRFILTL